MQVPAAKIYFSEEDRNRILKQVDEILERGRLILGKYTREFEEKFAEYVGVKYAVAVNSGTSPLEIPLLALEISAGLCLISPGRGGWYSEASGQASSLRVSQPLLPEALLNNWIIVMSSANYPMKGLANFALVVAPCFIPLVFMSHFSREMTSTLKYGGLFSWLPLPKTLGTSAISATKLSAPELLLE